MIHTKTTGAVDLLVNRCVLQVFLGKEDLCVLHGSARDAGVLPEILYLQHQLRQHLEEERQELGCLLRLFLGIQGVYEGCCS